MKKMLALLTTLILSVSVLAGNYPINSGQVVETCAKDFPAMFYFTNAREGLPLQINLVDLHDDNGPAMRFSVKLYGDNANGEMFSAISDGDITFFVPADLVGENTLAVVFDENRLKHYPDSTRYNWAPADFGFSAMQETPDFPEIEVYSKDHHLGNPMIYVWSLYLKNIGNVDLVEPTVRYYFTIENAETNLNLFDYYTPEADIQLLHVPGTNEYALEYHYSGMTLKPGETTKGAVENQVHLYYDGYATIDKANDFSNPIPEDLFIYPNSTLFTINKKVAVYDANGTLVEGEEKPGYQKGEFIPVQ